MNGAYLEMDVPKTVSITSGKTLRYLFADWPTPTVYAATSYLGPNEELPTAPFVLTIP